MQHRPKRALEEPELVVAPSPGSRTTRTRALSVGAALLTVAGLVGTMVVGSAVDGATPVTDPTGIAVPAVRDEDTSRSRSRAPLASPSATASAAASATPSPTVSPTPSATPSASSAPSPSPSASASASAKASSSATPTASTPSIPELGKVVGQRWTTTSVNVRKGPGTTFGVLRSVSSGRELTITNVLVDDRWRQVRLGEQTGFVAAKYLTDERPEPEATAEDGETAEASSEGGISTESCKRAASVERGLTARTVRVLRAICNEFPNVSSYGGYRADAGSYHNSGRAIDVMISGEAGWEIARWLRANANELGVIEVIYAQKIWTTQRSGDGWRSMSDRGSATANHYDHVHVSVR